MQLINNTPIESYNIGKYPVFVKREDLCCPSPGPPFSKVRGLIPVLERLKSEGITTVGYTETSTSMAGWCLAWGCYMLGGLKAVIFDPQYKKTPYLLKQHRKQWYQFDPDIIPIPAGRAKVNWHISKKILKKKYLNSYLLPLGLILPETIEATKKEALKTDIKNFNSLIIPIGSGTIAAGILKAVCDYNINIYGICCRETDISMKRNKIIIKGPGMGICGEEKKKQQKSPSFNLDCGDLMNVNETAKYLNISTTTVSIWSNKGYLKPKIIQNRKFYTKKKYPFKFKLVDPGWKYSEPCILNLPFTSHPFYDIKSVAWMIDNIENLKPPVLFWNIGALPKECYAQVQDLWRIQKIIDREPFSKTRQYYERLQRKIS